MKTPTWCAPYGGLAVRFGGRYPSWPDLSRIINPEAMPFSRGVQAASRSIVIIAYLSLSACATPPSVVTETIRVPTWIPVSVTLTAPVQVTLLPGVTYGEALGRLNAGLQTCNGQLQAISALKPPNQP